MHLRGQEGHFSRRLVYLYYKLHCIPTAGNIYKLLNWNIVGHRVFKVYPALPQCLVAL